MEKIHDTQVCQNTEINRLCYFKLQYKIIEASKNSGLRLLFNGMPEAAAPAALQCLKFSSQLYGSASVHLVIPYLMLTESSLSRLNKYSVLNAVRLYKRYKMKYFDKKCLIPTSVKANRSS